MTNLKESRTDRVIGMCVKVLLPVCKMMYIESSELMCLYVVFLVTIAPCD